MQNTGKRCMILLVFIILRWSFNYESNVFWYNKILIDCVFGNSKFVVPSTLTIDLGFSSVNRQSLGDNKLAIPSYPVNKYIISYFMIIKIKFWIKILRKKIIWRNIMEYLEVRLFRKIFYSNYFKILDFYLFCLQNYSYLFKFRIYI